MKQIDMMVRDGESIESMAKTFVEWNACKCDECKEKGIRGYAKKPYTMESARESAIEFINQAKRNGTYGKEYYE